MALIYTAYSLDHLEIIWPTFGALVTGSWLVHENLWHYTHHKLIISVGLCAIMGWMISSAISGLDYIYVYPCIYIAFLLTAAILIIGRTQIYPCFGAVILPILTRTTSWLYPVSVICLAVILVLGRIIFEHNHIREKLTETGFPLHRKNRIVYYLKTSLGIIPALIIVPLIGDHFILLPPLFVTYATFCNEKSSFVRHPIKTWIQMTAAALFGTALCMVSDAIYELNVSILAIDIMTACSAGCAVLLTMIVGRIFHRLFPPAMSLTLTPFLIQFHALLPLYVAIMGGYFILISCYMRRHPAYENEDLNYL